ncbi:MAG: S41 family peptidase [Actinobacteria bacterium]|nr:S41 family peptidase [Actinomycetota bacterium]
MKRTPGAAAGVLIALALAAASFAAGIRFAGGSVDGSFRSVLSTADRLEQEAAGGPSREDLARAAIEGMLEALDDPYARLVDAEDRRAVDDLVDGTMVGIGVWLQGSVDGLRVTGTVPDTPAERSGIRSGDLIVAVDGRDVTRLSADQAGELFTGDPGTTLRLTVLRRGEPVEVEVERAEIAVQDVRSRMLDGDVGYVQLLQFGRGAADQLREAVSELLRDGAVAVVLDLRHNTGGLADEAYRTAGLFLDGGVVATIREPGEPERSVFARGEPLPGFPLAVLVDGGTASASEILAGALQDRERAVVVGVRTYGKGSVLAFEEIPGTGETIQYTSAHFLTPDGHEVEGVGITPDLEVLPGESGDPQLDRAVEELLARAAQVAR